MLGHTKSSSRAGSYLRQWPKVSVWITYSSKYQDRGSCSDTIIGWSLCGSEILYLTALDQSLSNKLVQLSLRIT